MARQARQSCRTHPISRRKHGYQDRSTYVSNGRGNPCCNGRHGSGRRLLAQDGQRERRICYRLERRPIQRRRQRQGRLSVGGDPSRDRRSRYRGGTRLRRPRRRRGHRGFMRREGGSRRRRQGHLCGKGPGRHIFVWRHGRVRAQRRQRARNLGPRECL